MLSEERREKIGVWIAVTCLAACGVLIQRMMPDQLQSALGFPLIGTCILGATTALVWTYSDHHFRDWKKKMLPFSIMVISLCGFLIGGFWYYVTTLRSGLDSSDRAATSITLFAQCDIATRILVPASGSWRMLQIGALPIGGIATMAGTPGADSGFDQHPLYKCSIFNYGAAPIFDVRVSLRAAYSEAKTDPAQPGTFRSGNALFERDLAIDIPKIDPGKDSPFEFYVVHFSAHFVRVDFPREASAVMGLGGARQKAVFVSKPSMFFSPQTAPATAVRVRLSPERIEQNPPK